MDVSRGQSHQERHKCAPGRYLPACRMTHTGALGVGSPLAARMMRSFLSSESPPFSSAADFLVVKDCRVRVSLEPVPEGAPSCAMLEVEVEGDWGATSRTLELSPSDANVPHLDDHSLHRSSKDEHEVGEGQLPEAR